MTIVRLIVITTALLFMLVITSIFFVGIHNARISVNEQLQINADNFASMVATQIGQEATLFLQATGQNKNPAEKKELLDRAFTTAVNTTFDSAHNYQKLTLWDNSGREITEKEMHLRPVHCTYAACFFAQWVNLSSPLSREMEVSVNGQGYGKLQLQLSPKYVDRMLWLNTISQLKSIGLLALLGILGLSILVRIILRPLGRTRKQADDICMQRFSIQTNMPKTTDLRDLVNSMNKMSMKIKKTISELGQIAQLLRNKSNQNNLTGLSNYTYFKTRLRDLIRSEKDFMSGLVLFGSIHDIEAIYENKGKEFGDKMIQSVAGELQKLINQVYASFAAYVSHGERDIPFGTFAIVAPNLTLVEAEQMVKQITDHIRETLQLESHVGVVEFQDLGKDIIAPADVSNALEKLIIQGNAAFKKAREKNVITEMIPAENGLSEKDLMAILQNALAKKEIILERQAVQDDLSTTHQILQYELITSLPGPNNKMINAAAFKMIANENNLAIPLDQLTIETLLTILQKKPEDSSMYAIGLSFSAIQNPEFRTWLDTTLSRVPTLCSHLSFELYEPYVLKNFDNTQLLIQMLKKHHCRFGLDRVYRDFNSIDYLLDLEGVDYIKINGGCIYDIHKNLENQILIRALVEFAQNLDIDVMAEQVDLQEDYDFLQSLPIQGIVGYLTEAPSPLD